MTLEKKDQEHFDGATNHDTRMKKFVGNRSFNIQRVLDIKVPKMEIESFSKNVNLEETEFFHVFLKAFNDIYETEIEIDDLLYSKSNFKAFSNFIMYCGMKGHIVIRKDDLMGEFIQAFEKLQEKYEQNIPSMEKYYDEIIRRIYYSKGLTKKDEEVREEMYLFKQAYSLMKREFRKQIRENKKKVFEHLTGTMEIAIRELPNPNLNKIIIALLHDIQELFPEYAPIIRRIYGDYIADGIDVLSKKPLEDYFTEAELHQYQSTEIAKIKNTLERIAKGRRNEDYFGHLDDLNDDYLDDKFADRIHNLRDMDDISREKIQRKVQETEKYFLHVAQKRNPTAYNLIITELEKLKKQIEE